MKGYAIGVAVVLAVFSGSLARAKPERVDRILAVVDDEIILQSDVMSHLAVEAMRLGMSRQDLTGFRGQELFQQILDNMVQDQLLLAKAREDTIEVDAERVEEAVRAEIRRLKTEHGEATFVQELQAQGMTERELRENFRQRMRKEGIRQQMFQLLSQTVEISHKETEDFLDRYRQTTPDLMSISHILIEPKPSADRQAQARKRTKELLARVQKGEDFAEVARTSSEDPGTAPSGGDLGFFSRGQMVSGFEQAAFALRPGEVSDVVESEFGYHIIRVDDVDGDRVRARHILILLRPNEADIEGAQQEAVGLYRRIQEGEDFAELARQHSAHTETSGDGGRFPGLFSRDNLPPAFADRIGSMKPGEVSLPVKTEFGWHLVKLNDDRDTIEEMLKQIRLEEHFQKVM